MTKILYLLDGSSLKMGGGIGRDRDFDRDRDIDRSRDRDARNGVSSASDESVLIGGISDIYSNNVVFDE